MPCIEDEDDEIGFVRERERLNDARVFNTLAHG